jgi:hypothetical protein
MRWAAAASSQKPPWLACRSRSSMRDCLRSMSKMPPKLGDSFVERLQGSADVVVHRNLERKGVGAQSQQPPSRAGRVSRAR